MGCDDPLHTPRAPAACGILDYIDARSPQGADVVKRRLHAVVDLLEDHPESGRLTRKDGVRRAVARPYPYVIFYRSNGAGIVVLGIRHAARRPLRQG